MDAAILPNPLSASVVYLAILHSPEDLPARLKNWYGLDATPDARLTAPAYKKGATAVFSSSIPPESLAASLKAGRAPAAVHSPHFRYYPAGAVIFLETDQVMVIEEGIVSSSIVHGDGKQTLVGLWSKGDVLLPHPSDDCHLELFTYTPLKSKLYSWDEARDREFFVEELRRHLHLTEAWASMQTRPYLAQRLMGVLSLLAEQFGTPHSDGTWIDLRITHQMLASAVGANCTTISRLISDLKRLGKIETIGKGKA